MKSLNRYVEDPLIRSMRVQTWVEVVIQKSGKTTAELEQTFGLEGGIDASRSCIWNKYRSGKVVPRSGRHGNGRPKLVERVEALYPGTAKWLFSPLWRLADKAPMEMSEIRKVYEGLPNLIRSIFIHDGVKDAHVFWRRPIDSSDACEILLRFGSVEGFVALLAMIKEAEIVQDQELHLISFQAALQCVDWVKKYPLLAKAAGNLRSYLEARQHRVEYFSLPYYDKDSSTD